MTKIIDLDPATAKAYLLKPECYFTSDLPPYISFGKILDDVSALMAGKSYTEFENKPDRASNYSGVNYELLSTKDGRFSWRPLELIHPALYVSLVQMVCDPKNWELLQKRFAELYSGIVECTSFPMVADTAEKEGAAQVRNWWLRNEQRSIELSLEYTHLLKTDVSNCYGSLYTHSIPWALHGYDVAKGKKNDKSLLGNKIDTHVRDGRYGQTNGITQGSVLMDIIAELVLAYVDQLITESLKIYKDFRILRYRDDYSIFTNSDQRATEIVRTISDCLRKVGMQLGASKTHASANIVEGAVKPEKLAGIHLQDMDISQAKTLQKQLLRLHAFTRLHPNTGAVKRLAAGAFAQIRTITDTPDDLRVLIAIVCDIATISPSSFPALAGILAKLISLAHKHDQEAMWESVRVKIKKIPHNGYMEIWLQRVTIAKGVELNFDSEEPICMIVNKEKPQLWNNDWIKHGPLLNALDVSKIVVSDPKDINPVPDKAELLLFEEYAEFS